MADESIRSEPASLAKAAAQDDQEDRAAVSLRVLNVPAPVPATVDSANETVIDVLDAIPEGSSVSFSADQLAFLLSADEAIGPASEAHARVERFARGCGCSFLFRQQAGTGTFTKDKRTQKTAIGAGSAEYLAAPPAKPAHFLNATIVPPLLRRWIRELPPDAASSAANSHLQWRSSRRFDELVERQFHPEWGFLAPRRNFLGTIRVVLIASAIGALSGGGIVLWMEGGAPEDTGSVAARTLVPPRVEAPDKSSETASTGLPPQQQRELPLEASELKTAETTRANREGETARSELDANLPARQPSVQVETAEPRDHAPDASNGELGATGSKSRQASSLASPLPTDHSKPPQMAGRPASQRELVPKKPKMPELIERRSNQRDARNGDLSGGRTDSGRQ